MKFLITLAIVTLLCISEIKSQALAGAELTFVVNAILTERRGVNPLAADMKFVEWDAALAGDANTEAEKCKNTKDALSGKYVSHTFSTTSGVTVQALLNAFLNQKNAYDAQTRVCKNNAACEDYKQIVFKDTVKVGCAKKACSVITGVAGTPAGTTFVCVYTAPQTSGAAYTIGAGSCDSCPSGYTCDDKLCKKDATPPSGGGSNAGSSSAVTPFTDAEQEMIIKKVLEERRGVAPPAADMKFSEWSKDFADKAATQANGCTTTATAITGKNVIIVSDSDTSASPEKLIEKLISQKANYDAATRKCKSANNCGQYKQIIYKDMTMLGCAKKSCATITGASGAGIVFVCVFKEPDVVADPAYTVGTKSCDKCPEGYTCKDKLCTKGTSTTDDKSKTDNDTSSGGVTTSFSVSSTLLMCLFVKMVMS